jgi:hypothetical protein
LTHFFGHDIDITSQVLLIWSNILTTSEHLSQDLITADWLLAVLVRVCADFDRLYLSFMEFLTSVLKRYRILAALQTDILTDIRDIIVHSFELKSEDAVSVTLNCVRTVTAVANRKWVLNFFTSEILSAVVRAVSSEDPSTREDAIAILLSFSSLGEFALQRLLESGYTEFWFDGIATEDSVLCCLADTAANFLSASPSIALLFLETPIMKELMKLGSDASFDVKVRIARGLCFVCSRYPEVLLACGIEFLNLMLDCIDTADSGYVILVLEAVLVLLDYAQQNPDDPAVVAAYEILHQRSMEDLAESLLERDDLPDLVYQWINHISIQRIPAKFGARNTSSGYLFDVNLDE